jgi:midasin (ATPase involved in ribosome maturation)
MKNIEKFEAVNIVNEKTNSEKEAKNKDFKDDIEKNKPILEDVDSVSYLGVKLEKAKNNNSVYVPDRKKIEEFYVNDEFALSLQQKMAISMKLGQNLLIEGGTAIGKTTTIAKMCSELGYEFHYLNLNGQTDVDNLMGRYIPNAKKKKAEDPEYVFADGSVTSGLRQEEGKIKVIVLDEINATNASVLKRSNEFLNAVEQGGTVVLSEDANEVIKVSKETTKVVALMNPSG